MDSNEQNSNQGEKSVGPIIGIVIIIIILIIGALYFWGQRITGDKMMPASENTSQAIEQDQMTSSLQNVGTSDEIDSIVNDLNATNLDSIDQ